METNPIIDRMETIGNLDLTLSRLDVEGRLLDLCAGGEGVIGRLMDEQVVAVDASGEELAEAPDGPLKVIADAKELPFLDGAFSTATAFFGLMYIPDADLPAVFAETYRVLASGGQFLVWDCVIPETPPPGKDIAVCHLHVRLPDTEIVTGYGVPWPSSRRNADQYGKLARTAGFRLVQTVEDGALLKLTMIRP